MCKREEEQNIVRLSIEGGDWGELFDAYKEMSRAVGIKTKALWKMKAATDAG